MHGANLGTLLRTCDAVGACLAVPRLPWVPDALARGNTLRRPACVHWTGRDVVGWLAAQRTAGSAVVGVELADESVRLADLPAARQRTVAVLCHEQSGIPPEAAELIDVAAEIPMIGTGASLNVAVAGSLILYRADVTRRALRAGDADEGRYVAAVIERAVHGRRESDHRRPDPALREGDHCVLWLGLEPRSGKIFLRPRPLQAAEHERERSRNPDERLPGAGERLPWWYGRPVTTFACRR
jgi:tRNA (guanosine-2'-O-)-methyltransferase